MLEEHYNINSLNINTINFLYIKLIDKILHYFNGI